MPDEVKKEEAKTTNLKTVIEDAMTSVATEVGKEIEQEEKKEKEVKEEKKEETQEGAEDDLTAEQLGFVKNLYKGLNNKDPNIQLGTLKILANAVGMDLTAIKTEKQAEKAEETLVGLLKEGLGEYDFLADKLGPVLEKALDKFVEKKTADIREELRTNKETAQRAAIEADFKASLDEYDTTDEAKGILRDEVYRLMDSFRPSGKITPRDYFKSVIILAANNKNIELKLVNSKQKDERVSKNRQDAMSRLASERGADIKEVSRVPQRMSLKESVQDAMEKAAEELSKK
jgi:hypothetical protein